MINALHLLWIIPVSTWFGFFICAVLTVGSQADREGAPPNLPWDDGKER